MLNTMSEIISRNAALNGNRLAIKNEGRVYTHRQHAHRIWSLANAVGGTLGLARGSRLAILCQNRSEYLEIFGAAESGGFVAVTLNWRLAPAELAAIIDDSQADLLFVEQQLLGLWEQTQPLIASPVNRVILIGAANDIHSEYEGLLASGKSTQPSIAISPDDIAHIIYTSGSTGRAKGVMISQGALARAAGVIGGTAGLRPNDCMIVVMPLFHSGAKIEWSATQYLGGSCLLLRQFDEATILELMERERPTVAHLAPVMVKRLVEHPDCSRRDTSSIRQINYGSAPVPAEDLVEATNRFGAIFAQIYGMTESITNTILLPFQASLKGTEQEQRRLSSAGQPFPGTSLRITDDAGNSLPVGQVGEIEVKSVGLMSGYWNMPALTQAAFNEGWLRTGDVGRIDDDGFLFIVDRKKDMIISGGENVYSAEVENCVAQHPAVAQCAVIGIPSDQWGEAVHAIVTRKNGASVTAEDLIAFCRERIAAYKCPRSIDIRDGMLPLSGAGKILKRELRAPFWEGKARRVN
jgi:acyl-CoA synthetase (AMP-forming)/AMP-acid ligase II